MKLTPVENQPGTFMFECPGCGCGHNVWTKPPGPTWGFNGDLDRPTLTPSLLVRSGNEKGPTVCHSFVTDGKIQFLNDCTHELAGQTVELPEL